MTNVMHRRFIITVLGLLSALYSAPASADETEVKKMVQGYVDVFNGHDAAKIAAMWTPEAVHVDHATGTRLEGRAAIETAFSAVFKANPDARLTVRVDRVRQVTPDVIALEGESTLEIAEAEPTLSAFSGVIVRRDDGWLIDSIEERELHTVGSTAALEELSGLLGRWVDQTEDVQVETTFRWSPDRTFLIRSFVVQTGEAVVQQGTQVIGWDPRSLQIRSWSFNSDGGFGDGTWTRDGDAWLIRSSQTLPDGQAASGTFVMTLVDDDTVTLQLIGREIEGEPLPASEKVTMIRAPKSADASGESDN